MINSFAQFYHIKAVFLKAFSEALELLQGLCCGQSLAKVELSLVKGIILISRTLNRMLPIRYESLFLSEVQGFPQIPFPRAPLWVRIYSQHTLGNAALSFSSPCSSWFFSSQNWSLSSAPITPQVSSQLPRAPSAAQQTSRRVQLPREQRHGLHVALCRPCLATVEYISSNKWFTKTTRAKEMRVHIRTHTHVHTHPYKCYWLSSTRMPLNRSHKH